MMANPTLVDDKENTSNSSGKHGKGKFVQQLGELEDARRREDCLSLAFFGVAIFYILASAHPATEAIGDDASFSLFLVPYIKPHPNVESLKRALKKAWKEITYADLVKIVDNFPKRLQACIDANGGHFE
uniref:Uncharacterized protein n=1 Tax=Acrobeloides nanus TaxID=290746 RepID=A0A914CPN4_9BILA